MTHESAQPADATRASCPFRRTRVSPSLRGTGMLGIAGQLRDRLAAKGLHVPVVDPTGAAVTWLESCVRLGLTPSRTTYMPPPAKDRCA